MDQYGIEVERRRREITAHHGVPDFVFRPVDVPKGPKGSAQREVGDFLLWVGDVVVIVSHKARLPESAQRESQARRRNWIDGAIRSAYDQIRGVARNLQSAVPGQIVLRSERGVSVPWNPADIREYVGVVVVDAIEPDEAYAPLVMDERFPTIAMLASDWDALVQLLPSTVAIVNYVAKRADRIPRCPVGSELDVFALLVEEEQTGRPLAIPPGGLPKNHLATMQAEHPDWFLGGHGDDRFAYIVNAMIEGAADLDPDLSTTTDPLDYMKVVTFLDSIPLLTRVELGKSLVERWIRVGQVGGRVSGMAPLRHGLLIHLTDDGDRASRAEWSRDLTMARHSQALDAGAPHELTTLGVATQPLPSPTGRAFDFALIRGGIRSDPDFRSRRDEIFGAPDMRPIVERWTDS